APGPVPGSGVGADPGCDAGGAEPSAGGPAFDPARMDPTQLAEVLGPETAAVIASSYRAGTAPSATAPSAADHVLQCRPWPTTLIPTAPPCPTRPSPRSPNSSRTPSPSTRPPG